MKPCNVCARQQLKNLLDESLPEPIEVDIADHIATCSICQEELETLAGMKDWWNEVSDRLSKSSLEIGAAGKRISNECIPPQKTRVASTSADRALHNASNSAHSSNDFSDDGYIYDFAVDFLDPSDDMSMLGRLGEYEIVEVIGRGGMGIVLKGYQKELQRYVAVKVLSPHLATSGAARRRFAREAQATAAVVNPHVMAIHSVHANSKLPYLVMPFTACESLQERLDRGGPLELRDVLRIGMQAALGLAAAHAQGLVHRDVKPANILLETNVDRVMLTDFGLARAVDDATLTRTGIIAGTPQYMSPEQANGDPVDHRSDLFSLGSVLYAMCTARPPFRAESTFGVLRRIRETEPRSIVDINTDIPQWFERIVMRLQAKLPDDRPASATDIAMLLENCLAHVQQPTAVELPEGLDSSTTSARSQFSTRRIGLYLSGAIVVVIAVVGISFLTAVPRRSIEKNSLSPTVVSKSDSAIGVNSTTDDPAIDWDKTQSDLNSATQSLRRLEDCVTTDLESTETDSDDGQSQSDVR